MSSLNILSFQQGSQISSKTLLSHALLSCSCFQCSKDGERERQFVEVPIKIWYSALFSSFYLFINSEKVVLCTASGLYCSFGTRRPKLIQPSVLLKSIIAIHLFRKFIYELPISKKYIHCPACL